MSNATLCLHAGAERKSLEQVAAVRTPDATATWQPIAHIDVRDLVAESIRRAGFSIQNEEYALSRDGQRFFGVLGLEGGHYQAPDYQLQIGVRNSHDQSFPAGGLLGHRVFVCDNLAFSGEVKFSRRHTKYAKRDLPDVVGRGVEQLLNGAERQAKRIESYKEQELGRAAIDRILVESIERGMLPPTRLPLVMQEIKTPTYDYGVAKDTAWSVMNAYTHALKGAPQLIAQRTLGLHVLMDEVIANTPSAMLGAVIDATQVA